jgi:hypothetical protein
MLIRHDDDEVVDEIRIVTVPRYKTSGLSGDEWRVSARIEFWRKGQLLGGRSLGNVDTAVKHLGHELAMFLESQVGALKATEGLCGQPGCKEPYVSEYRLKEEYCGRCGRPEPASADQRIRFCHRHLQRGDCGLRDADTNYEVISGPGPDEAAGYEDDVRESGVVIL